MPVKLPFVRCFALAASATSMDLVEDTANDITWKLSNLGSYTTASAYKTQFEGMTNSYLLDAVWKN
jgi:hypothetical protein